MKPRKQPLRKCVACQEMIVKKQLVRVVRTPEGAVLIDRSGKMNGRGAYLCGDPECVRIAKKQRSLERSLKHSIDAEMFLALEEYVLTLIEANSTNGVANEQ